MVSNLIKCWFIDLLGTDMKKKYIPWNRHYLKLKKKIFVLSDNLHVFDKSEDKWVNINDRKEKLEIFTSNQLIMYH